MQKDATRPQLFRAMGRVRLRRGDSAGAIAALEESAALARAQHWPIQLGRTMAVLADAARQRNDVELATRSDAERAAVVERIGPEVRGLAWAHGLPRPRRAGPGSGRSIEGGQTAPLSPREREVAALIAQGLTDRQIADRLTITEGTAGVHVGHILNKLGFHVRSEIASWAVQRGLAGASESPR